MIDLNSTDFDSKSIFNEGVAGLVNNVTIKVVPATPQEIAEKKPNYNLVFIDQTGAETRKGYYVIDRSHVLPNVTNQQEEYDKRVKNQGRELKHIILAVHGPAVKFPQFQNEKQMLDMCMQMIHQSPNPAKKYRVFCNYGSPSHPKEFLEVRRFVPFIESEDNPEITLIQNKNDLMEPIRSSGGSLTSGFGQTPVSNDWANPNQGFGFGQTSAQTPVQQQPIQQQSQAPMGFQQPPVIQPPQANLTNPTAQTPVQPINQNGNAWPTEGPGGTPF